MKMKAKDEANKSAEVLRSYTLKMKENDHYHRVIGELNMEMSPFKDEDTRDSLFMRELLDMYRTTEDFKAVSTDRQIERKDKLVHHYLKVMESGDAHPDTKTLQELRDGDIEETNEAVERYLCKRLQNVPLQIKTANGRW